MLLVIDKKHAELEYRSGVIILKNEKERQKYPLKQIDTIVVMGNVMASASVWRAIASENIACVFFPSQGKKEEAMLLGGTMAVQLPTRILQFKNAFDPQQQLKMAGHFVHGKINSYQFVFRVLHDQLKVANFDFDDVCEQARYAVDKASDTGVLMGIEGQLAARWFELLSMNMPERWGFKGRNRRPPRDPLNALLSLGYGLLYSQVFQVLIASGYDPAQGFLHQQAPARYSLVLDFMELFRSAVDLFSIQWLIQYQDDIQSFFYYREDTGCRLSKKGRPLYFAAWANWLLHWPRTDRDLLPSGSYDGQLSTNELNRLIRFQAMNFRDLLKEYVSRTESKNNVFEYE